MSKKLIPCKICGVTPGLNRSNFRRLVSHKCCDFNSGWGSETEVVEIWNVANSQDNIERNDSAESDDLGPVNLNNVEPDSLPCGEHNKQSESLLCAWNKDCPNFKIKCAVCQLNPNYREWLVHD